MTYFRWIYAFIFLCASHTFAMEGSTDVEGLTGEFKTGMAGVGRSGAAADDPAPDFRVGIQRDIPGQDREGIYFAKSASLRIVLPADAEEGTITMPGYNQDRLTDMDAFLLAQGTWSRNHLAVDLFALVHDKRDDAHKVIEGSMSAEATPDQFTAGQTVFNFDIRMGGLAGDKYADFVSTPIGTALDGVDHSDRYTYIHKSALRPQTDDGNHGDRLALDAMLCNPDLFFKLIRRKAHREDLEILGMGARYYSSYDACNDCFSKLCEERGQLKTALNTIAGTQQYNTGGAEFPFYTSFYSARPYIDTSYVATWKPTATASREKITTRIPYNGTIEPIIYHLDLSRVDGVGVNGVRTAPLAANGTKSLHLKSGNITMKENKIYMHVQALEPTDATTIEYKTV